MIEFIQGIIRPIWELLIPIGMSWRAIILFLILLPVFSLLFWRVLPWFLAKFSSVVAFCIETLAKLLLLVEYAITKRLRKRRNKIPDIIYTFDDVLIGVVNFFYSLSSKLNQLLKLALQKRWQIHKAWFVVSGIIIVLMWFVRPVFAGTRVGKMIDNGVIFLYSIDSWISNTPGRSLDLDNPSPTEFTKAYYSAINQRQYASTWQYISPKFQNNMQAGFISYIDWWEQKIEKVEVQKVTLKQENHNSAIVHVRLRYFLKNQKKPLEPESVSLWLLREPKTKRWMINHSRIISENVIKFVVN